MLVSLFLLDIVLDLLAASAHRITGIEHLGYELYTRMKVEEVEREEQNKRTKVQQ
jgi:hypothetical protein